MSQIADSIYSNVHDAANSLLALLETFVGMLLI